MPLIRSIFLIFFLLLIITSFGQKNAETYYDVNGNEINKDEARYHSITNKENDSSWMIAYYNKDGPLRRMEHYKDKKHTIKHGRFEFFNLQGYIDSAGNFINGIQQGKWVIYSDAIPYQEKIYQDGVAIQTKDIDEKGISAQNSSLDTSQKLNAVESKFPGGEGSWDRYMLKNLKMPDEVVNTINHLDAIIIVGFTIETDGTVHEIQVLKSRLYELDKVATDLIKNSGKWIPATLNGVATKSYKRQPIAFKIISM